MWLCGTALRCALLMLPVAAAAVVAASRVLLFGEVRFSGSVNRSSARRIRCVESLLPSEAPTIVFSANAYMCSPQRSRAVATSYFPTTHETSASDQRKRQVSLAPAATLFDTLVHRASQEVDTARLAVGCLETTVC